MATSIFNWKEEVNTLKTEPFIIDGIFFHITLFFACEESCSSGANSMAFSGLPPSSPEQNDIFTQKILPRKLQKTEIYTTTELMQFCILNLKFLQQRLSGFLVEYQIQT